MWIGTTSLEPLEFLIFFIIYLYELIVGIVVECQTYGTKCQRLNIKRMF